MKIPSGLSLFIASVALAPAAHATFQLNVESFRDGNIPAGYTNVTGGVASEEMIKVSEEPYLDYLIPNNQGSVGITAQKAGGQYISASTVAELPGGGSNNLRNPDRYHPVFEWFDGEPLPFGSEYSGVSWGGWSANEVARLTTQITLPNPDPILIYHWFNDGWNYDNGGHTMLSGHGLTVSLFDSVGTLKQQQVEILPSGGAEDIFGDHRQFYTALIAVSGHAVGDIVIIQNEGGNVGFKGTAVARGSAIVDPEPESILDYAEGEFGDDARLGSLYGLGGRWVFSPILGNFFDRYPWIYLPAHGWFYHFEGANLPGGAYFQSVDYGPVWTSASSASQFYRYGQATWTSF